MSHWRDLDIALTLAFLAFLMYVPDLWRGYRNFKIGRALARQITAEHEARKALEKLGQ
jgi:hypothetical protein